MEREGSSRGHTGFRRLPLKREGSSRGCTRLGRLSLRTKGSSKDRTGFGRRLCGRRKGLVGSCTRDVIRNAF